MLTCIFMDPLPPHWHILSYSLLCRQQQCSHAPFKHTVRCSLGLPLQQGASTLTPAARQRPWSTQYGPGTCLSRSKQPLTQTAWCLNQVCPSIFENASISIFIYYFYEQRLSVHPYHARCFPASFVPFRWFFKTCYSTMCFTSLMKTPPPTRTRITE